MAELIRIEGVALESREGRRVFEQLDWSLAPGGRARIHAAPGEGASAFLRLCAGLADPEQGTVSLDGTPLSAHGFGHPFLASGGLGWIPGEGGLLVNLSLQANLALPLRFLRGQSRAKAEETALLWLAGAGLASQAQLRPHALDPVERWLGALVRAAVSEPRLWLLDEPPSVLDAKERNTARRLIAEAAANRGTAFVIVGAADDGALEATEYRIADGRLEAGGAR